MSPGELTVVVDDLTSPEVRDLVAGHLRAMHGSSPPGQVHALALEGLRVPEVTFFAARLNGKLCGCGALKQLDAQTGEIKSMHTLPDFQRKGVARAVLEAILQTATGRGYRRLLLETGSGPSFEAAQQFYAGQGFVRCGAFGDYVATDFNVFMEKKLDLPIGAAVTTALPVPRPERVTIRGASCSLEPLIEAHAADLIAAESDPSDPSSWTYMSYGPFCTVSEYAQWIRDFASSEDPLFYAIRDHARDQVVGVASYLRISPEHASIEVGHIHYSPRLQRSRAASEAMFLMMRYAFELGYRRYEWKCHSLNAASRRAATRLGFTFEGIHRQALVVRGHNRDTAWYSILDSEWPARRVEFERWLADANFDADGRQRSSLSMPTG